MEKVYNKLNRLTISDFEKILNDLNISHSRCKTKNDYIRAFLKKKARSAKLTPKKIMKKRAKKIKEGKDFDESSVSSYYSKCIIEDMEDSDVHNVESFIKHAKPSRSKSSKSRKRRKSTPKKTKNKAVKVHEKEEVSTLFQTLPSPSRKKIQKKSTGQPKSSKRVVTRLSASATSTPKKLDIISEALRSEYEETPYNGVVISEISEREEVSSSDREICEEPYPFSPDTPENTRDQLRKRNGRPTRMEIKDHTPIRSILRQPREDIQNPEERRTPLKRLIEMQQRFMTPVKKFASRVQSRVEGSYLIKSEMVSTILLISMVTAFMLAGAINYAGKVPAANYRFPVNATIKHMEYDNLERAYVCQEGTLSVGHLCAKEGDQDYIDEVLAINSDFDELIQNYDRCGGIVNPIVRPVAHPETMKEIAENDLFKHRIQYKELGAGEYSFSIHKDFKVVPTSLSRIQCSLKNLFGTGNGAKILLIFLLLLVIAFACYKVCQIIQESDTRTAKKIFNLILREMRETGMYRNGLDPSNIYTWYSSKTDLTKEEFDSRVLPWIQVYFNESEIIRSTMNRTGVAVWKLVE
ncbi:unnamed protein product [Moneuplotes crassus]|uniref:Uncharacterized protein n=1 Tax=Euplotes crassus TaxID=5936 RepID=A0AAD1X6T1_EUPCR|nr:unnamed protein product [Moneuplotes crassus]